MRDLSIFQGIKQFKANGDVFRLYDNGDLYLHCGNCFVLVLRNAGRTMAGAHRLWLASEARPQEFC